ncbi:MAG: hypothetical protein PHH54_00300 [Candidatus Nanoarchaeia archaeon]|nr:hypothetical protein [Candidatus Nanoarchaeia archaeon]MDD5740403.1 hypothetical protein [Candidatus Nanoarchaeia archaeon]
MREGRAAGLGKYIAKSIRQYAALINDPSYAKTIKRILSEEEFKPRKKGSPNPKKNKSALAGIPYDEFDVSIPEHHAALLIERGHFNYNADTANRIRKSLLEHL